jgi:peptidoglycan/LPS O-acetylase OafA/YrhL
LGGWAIGLFFFISGLLVTGSAERSGKKRFWAARARRIFPGLSISLFGTLAIALACGATAGFSETVVWFARAISLVSIEHRLPEAFAGNPIPEVVNGPLWSLFYEVVAYCICACFVWVVGARSKGAVLALLALAVPGALMHEALPGRLATFSPLLVAFAFGSFCYLHRERVWLNATAVVIYACLTAILPWELAIGPVSMIVITLVMSAPALKLSHDASYGLYIYGWPISQGIVHMLPGIAPVPLAVLAVLCTFPLALLSWCFVERPCLGVRRAVV